MCRIYARRDQHCYLPALIGSIIFFHIKKFLGVLCLLHLINFCPLMECQTGIFFTKSFYQSNMTLLNIPSENLCTNTRTKHLQLLGMGGGRR